MSAVPHRELLSPSFFSFAGSRYDDASASARAFGECIGNLTGPGGDDTRALEVIVAAIGADFGAAAVTGINMASGRGVGGVTQLTGQFLQRLKAWFGNRKISVAPYVEDRMKLAERLRSDSRKRGSITDYRWDNYRGDYAANSMELVLEQQVRGLLRGRSLGQPLVVVDFGGGRGVTFSRLATTFEQNVKREEIAFVVTNLARQPNRPGGLVHFLRADAEELLDARLRLPSGTEIPVVGNVALMHERLALTHGVANDIHFALLGKTFSDRGTFFMFSRNLTHPSVGLPSYIDPYRWEATEHGTANLRNMGFGHLKGGERDWYDVFTRNPDVAKRFGQAR